MKQGKKLKGETNASIKIKNLMNTSCVNAEMLANYIKEHQTRIAKNACEITATRIRDIVKGESPTIAECIMIGQALGKDLWYFADKQGVKW